MQLKVSSHLASTREMRVCFYSSCLITQIVCVSCDEKDIKVKNSNIKLLLVKLKLLFQPLFI